MQSVILMVNIEVEYVIGGAVLMCNLLVCMQIWVKWFGDHSFAQADPDQLKTLSEGLETHHNARKKDRQ